MPAVGGQFATKREAVQRGQRRRGVPVKRKEGFAAAERVDLLDTNGARGALEIAALASRKEHTPRGVAGFVSATQTLYSQLTV
jgi:hypothetical protein